MGLKFKDKTSLGDPQPGDVAERELQLDLKDKSIYSSTNGTDLIRISQPEVVGKKWKSTNIYQKGDLVTYPKAFVGGFTIDDFFISTSDNNVGKDPVVNTTDWHDARIVRYLSEAHEITIGGNGAAAGDFDNLETCLLYLGRFVAVDGAQITIKILSGHVIDYGVNIGAITLPAGLVIIAEADVSVIVHPTKQYCAMSFNSISVVAFFGITFNISGSNSHNTVSPLRVIAGNFSFQTCDFNFLSTFTPNSSTIGYIGFQDGSLKSCKISLKSVAECFVIFQNCKNLHYLGLTGTTIINIMIRYQGASGRVYGCNFHQYDGTSTPLSLVTSGLIADTGSDVYVLGSYFRVGGLDGISSVITTTGSTIRLNNTAGSPPGGYNQVINVPTANGIIYAKE